MIAFRVEIWCSGCGLKFAQGCPFVEISQAGRRALELEACAIAAAWIQDGAAHFCPSCQSQRASDALVEPLAIPAPEEK